MDTISTLLITLATICLVLAGFVFHGTFTAVVLSVTALVLHIVRIRRARRINRTGA